MPAVKITPEDLEPFADIPEDKALAMIEDAMGMAELIAPCIASDDFKHAPAAKAILREAILRRHEAGTGSVQTNTAGIYGQTVDTSKPRRVMFWPSEIQQLQEMCREPGKDGAYAVDMVDRRSLVVHADICSINLGAEYCSCGAVITANLPLYEKNW